MISCEVMTNKEIVQDGDIIKEEGELIFNPYNYNNREISGVLHGVYYLL